MPIDANYKSHDIHVTAFELPATREWEPRITICWSEGSYIMIKLPDIAPKHFSTRGSRKLRLSICKEVDR
jgi:hypothetical protein